MAGRVVIVGAGTAGTIVANRLRAREPGDEVVVPDSDDRQIYQPGNSSR